MAHGHDTTKTSNQIPIWMGIAIALPEPNDPASHYFVPAQTNHIQNTVARTRHQIDPSIKPLLGYEKENRKMQDRDLDHDGMEITSGLERDLECVAE